jgi:thiol-disulfide isomerase/thioredoxin
MTRRTVLAAGVAAAAALAGAGVAWWRLQPGAVAEAAPDSLWGQQWESPQGQAVAMAALRGRPLLLNFWATWCPPCVEELPMLDEFFRQHRDRGLQVLGLAIDQPSAVRAFLERRPLSFPVGLAGLGGTELSRQLGNSGGGLPFSVLFDRQGRLVERKLGRLQPDDLQRWQHLI